MNDYKLITIDIDGTLLNSYGDLTIENKEAIQERKTYQVPKR